MHMFNVLKLYKKKYLIAPLEAVVEVDWSMKALCIYKSLIREKLSSQLSFCQKNVFCEPNSFMHMFQLSTLYRQSIKLAHQKLW